MPDVRHARRHVPAGRALYRTGAPVRGQARAGCQHIIERVR